MDSVHARAEIPVGLDAQNVRGDRSDTPAREISSTCDRADKQTNVRKRFTLLARRFGDAWPSPLQGERWVDRRDRRSGGSHGTHTASGCVASGRLGPCLALVAPAAPGGIAARVVSCGAGPPAGAPVLTTGAAAGFHGCRAVQSKAMASRAETRSAGSPAARRDRRTGPGVRSTGLAAGPVDRAGPAPRGTPAGAIGPGAIGPGAGGQGVPAVQPGRLRGCAPARHRHAAGQGGGQGPGL